jgi:hypothetical protein
MITAWPEGGISARARGGIHDKGGGRKRDKRARGGGGGALGERERGSPAGRSREADRLPGPRRAWVGGGQVLAMELFNDEQTMVRPAIFRVKGGWRGLGNGL